MAATCLIGWFRWRRPTENPSALRVAAEKLANDFRVWLGLGAAVWLWFIVTNALAEIRRNNEIVALRNDTQSIANVINRLVVPRRLTNRQKEIIRNFLSDFPPHEFAFTVATWSPTYPNDGEASEFSADIRAALTKAGWKLTNKDPYINSADVIPGLSINMLTPRNSIPSRDNRYDKADTLLTAALGMAGVKIDGSIGSGDDPNADRDYVRISIGHRRMDSYVFQPQYPDQEQ